jgi:hypothetical protein
MAKKAPSKPQKRTAPSKASKRERVVNPLTEASQQAQESLQVLRSAGARRISSEPCPFCNGKGCPNCLNTGFVRVIR